MKSETGAWRTNSKLELNKVNKEEKKTHQADFHGDKLFRLQINKSLSHSKQKRTHIHAGAQWGTPTLQTQGCTHIHKFSAVTHIIYTHRQSWGFEISSG